jgi:hypothetical protein
MGQGVKIWQVVQIACNVIRKFCKCRFFFTILDKIEHGGPLVVHEFSQFVLGR